MEQLKNYLLQQTGMSEEEFDRKVEEYKKNDTNKRDRDNLGKTLVSVMQKQAELEQRILNLESGTGA
jgi:hypothetical protein